MEKRASVGLLNVNIFFLMSGIALLLLGSIVQSRDFNSGILITEYLIILVPNIMYLMINKVDLKSSLRLNKISLKELVCVVLIMLVAYPIGGFLNGLVINILSKFIEFNTPGVELPTTFPVYLKSLFVVGLAPGICEEVMFRGTILSSYERLGRKKAIIYSSILFGLFHFNIYNFIGPAFLGLVLGIMVYKSNSIFTGMIGHSLNNSIAMTIGFGLTRLMGNFEEMGVDISQGGESIPLISSLIVLGFILGLAFLLIYLLKSFPSKEIPDLKFGQVEEKMTLLEFIPIIFVIGIFIFVNFKIYRV